MDQPNILLILTDQERYPPPYESDEARVYRRDHLSGRERLRDAGVELHRHYVASTACAPSRASLFTGQYPSLHGVTQTDGLAKSAWDPAMVWLDPDTVPTLGDWFRAGGYRTEYRGKWHISHADLPVAGRHTSLRTNDRDGSVLAERVTAYRNADRLDPFGFSGWIGREPHGADPTDTGFVRDELFADQVRSLFTTLADDRGTPWIAVASLVNPHDIAFSGAGWQLLGFPEPDDSVPDPGEAPSQSDSFAERPRCHEAYRVAWAEMLYEQPTDAAYRRFYLWLHEVVDRAIERIVDGLHEQGLADDTIIVFTSDHGELLGAHGGLQQKWHNAFDETVRIPFVACGPGIPAGSAGITAPTSHVDVLPTLLGLAGIDAERAAKVVGERHVETQPPVGRDLTTAIRSGQDGGLDAAPVYFMTEDQISRGLRTANQFTGERFDVVGEPGNVESVVAPLPSGDGSSELWKLNHYYASRDEPEAEELAPSEWELHNLTADPEERRNLAGARVAQLGEMRHLLLEARATYRRSPLVTNRAEVGR
ncbi:MAG TPA: sulfatase-like hydrolase/transferase [Acidimicrobiia bacterium]|nr:sulfatase-like hydrolase/transferase [Acidimicrobiia bacterium]